MRVKDVMTRDVAAAGPDTPLVAAARQMRQRNVGCLPVVEGGRLVGMLTDSDITLRVVADGHDVNRASVRDAMSTSVVACRASQSVEEARRMMQDNHLKHLPVMDRRRLVGLVSFRDIAEDIPKCRLHRVIFYKQITASLGQRRDVAVGTVYLSPAIAGDKAVETAIGKFEGDHGATPWQRLADRYALEELG
jgi:CBS domain-containing protein